jgi:hypothetical protein
MSKLVRFKGSIEKGMGKELKALFVILCLFIVWSSAGLSSGNRKGTSATDSLELAYLHALSKLSHPKLEERKRVVRGYQQRGYASSLRHVLDGNGLSAILSYLKTRLQIELSLPHEPILVNVSALREVSPLPMDSLHLLPRKRVSVLLPSRPNQQIHFGLDIDWTFPIDPWSRP